MADKLFVVTVNVVVSAKSKARAEEIVESTVMRNTEVMDAVVVATVKA